MGLKQPFAFRQKLYLTLVLAVGGTLTILLANLWLTVYLNRLMERIQRQREKILFSAVITENEARLHADLAAVERASPFLDSILPLPDDLIDFPRDLSLWANQHNIAVGFSFTGDTIGTGDNPGYSTFILSATGTLADIFNLLKSIESGRYLIKFNQYDVAADSGKYTLLINGQIFSR